MRRLRGRLTLLVLVLAVLAAALAWRYAASPLQRLTNRSVLTPRTEMRRFPVFLLVVDALRRDRLGSYGYPVPTSPNLDSLARESAVFTNAYTQGGWTLPAMYSLFTGSWTSDPADYFVDVADVGTQTRDPFLLDKITLPTVLKGAGYRTAAVVTNPWLNTALHFDDDFDVFLPMLAAHRAEQVVTEAGRLLEGRPPGEPQFLFLHFIDIHLPYNNGIELLPVYVADPSVSRQTLAEFNRTFEANHGELRWDAIPAAQKRTLTAYYDSGIRYVDTWIGRLLDDLQAKGLYDESVIIVTADHGEAFGDHEGLGHGASLYEEIVRVPLIVKLPKSVGYKPATIRDGVMLADVVPTLADLIGAQSTQQTMGTSLMPLLTGRGSIRAVSTTLRQPRSAFSERPRVVDE